MILHDFYIVKGCSNSLILLPWSADTYLSSIVLDIMSITVRNKYHRLQSGLPSLQPWLLFFKVKYFTMPTLPPISGCPLGPVVMLVGSANEL
mgnify:CR=1 FL=1